MKRIHDERLKIRNLKNIRIVFLVENSLIILMLLWQAYKNHTNSFSFGNPLYVVLMISAFTLIILSINISAPTEDKPKLPIHKIAVRFLLELIVATVIFFLLLNQKHLIIAFLSGIVIAAVLSGIDLYSNHFRK